MNAGTLLLTEQRSVIDAGSLISDDSELSASAALYLAKLISVAPPLARKIVTDPSASSLRMSLATVIADVEGNGEDAKQASDEPSPFESILQLISACLESGNAPDAAYFLLGISVDERSGELPPPSFYSQKPIEEPKYVSPQKKFHQCSLFRRTLWEGADCPLPSPFVSAGTTLTAHVERILTMGKLQKCWLLVVWSVI